MVWNDVVKQNIPEGWQVKAVKDCVEHICTGLNPRDNFTLGNGNIRYITVKNLTSKGMLDFSSCDFIDEDARSIIHRRSDISVGDILFASIAPLGRCYLIQETPTDWDINESVFSIRPNQIVRSSYLYLFFVSERFIRAASSCTTGSIFKGIRINSLLDTAIIVPPDEILSAFDKNIQPLFQAQKESINEVQSLTSLRNWLLPMLMNGQAAVTD